MSGIGMSKVKEIICQVCGVVSNQYNIGAHVKKYHNLDPNEYKLKHGIKKEKKPRKCLSCGSMLNKGLHYSIKWCSDECKDDVILYRNHKKYDGMKEGIDYVSCSVCSWRARDLKRHIIESHNGVQEYKKDYPESPIVCEDLRDIYRNNITGDANPGYQHNGRLSPFSKKFVGYEGMDDKEKEMRISKLYNSDGYLNRTFTTRIDYWFEKCGEIDKAKELLSKRQSTFSLERCIDKYGYDEGYQVWKDRQVKWMDTLLSRYTQEELYLMKVEGMSNAGYITFLDEDLEKDFSRYRSIVWSYTNKTLRHHEIENIERRGILYHLDHKLSIKEGFIENIHPSIVGSLPNLEIISAKDNLSKNYRSSISKDELVRLYEEMDTCHET